MAKTSLQSFTFLLISLLAGYGATAQTTKLTEDDLKVYEQKSRDLVAFLQFMLNTVGDKATSARDKEVIISESYLKIFRDAQVQVEDDLLANRDVPINKDVTAYFKDVDFFFNHAQFEFEIVKVEPLKRDNGQWYFKIETSRLLKATDLEGKAVSNTVKRFIEINLNADNDDLKIASIYTTRVSRERALRAWWNSLSYEWMGVLQAAAGVAAADSLSTEQLVAISALDSLDISDNRLLLDLNPVEMLPGLVYLKLSNTRIIDLSPVRSLSDLQHLDISNSMVYDITFLKYSEKLIVFNASNTSVYDLTELSDMPDLRQLSLKKVATTNFEPLGVLTGLRELDVSSTSINSLLPLAKLEGLEKLDISTTAVTSLQGIEGMVRLRELYANEVFVNDLAPLAGLTGLKVLYVNDTPVSSLGPLLGLPGLEKIYCDNTSVTTQQADGFMEQQKKTLVIMNSSQLEEWWSGLTSEWRMALGSLMNLTKGQKPTKEQLVTLVNMDSLTLVGRGLSNLGPVERLKKLRYLDISKNPVSELIALSGLGTLKVLKANDTPIENIVALKGVKGLERLELINTKVYDLEVITGLPALRFLNVDDTFVTRGSIVSLLRSNPGTLVIFQTSEVLSWWEALSADWQTVFRRNHKMSASPTSEELHTLLAQPDLDASGGSIESLAPLYAFLDIKELNLSSTGLSGLTELARLDNLEKLNLSKNPVTSLQPIQALGQLRHLDVSNTPVTDLREIDNLKSLVVLNCAGTQLKNLRGIEKFTDLKEIDFSNTKVGRLDRLIEVSGLQSLTCFNTRVSSREIEGFKEQLPDCKVTYY